MESSASDNHHLWRFMTNHAHVLEAIASEPTVRLRDIAAAVGITERTAAQIVNDLEEAGYLTKIRMDAATATRVTTSCRSDTLGIGTTRSAS
jgi:DNA-binding MarR family transcriptional regulator